MIHGFGLLRRGVLLAVVAGLTAVGLGAVLLTTATSASHAQGRSLAGRSLASRVAAPGSGQRGFAARVRLPGGRRIYLTCRGRGRPTVILESGLGNGADVWGGPYLAAKTDPSAAPRRAVLPAVARFTRVCAYDRPGTSLLDTRTGGWRPGRSDPVVMPRTALDVARDLHTLLRQASTLPAAHLRGPYVLVGHSFGGLTQRLYATLHPRQTAGLVLVDASPPDYGATLARLLAKGLITLEQYAALAEGPRSGDLENRRAHERVDFEASGAQVRQAQADAPLPRMPLVFLSQARLHFPADWQSGAVAAMQRTYRLAQTQLSKLVPGARHVIARRSGHYIQIDQPKLVIDAIRRVVTEAR